MKHGWWLILLVFGALGCGLSSNQPNAQAGDQKEDKKEEKKGTVVDLDGLQARTPAAWVEEEPSNAMRLAQFRLPRVQGDDHDAELVIFKGIGGSAKSNIERWKTFFLPPEGKTIDEVAKVTEIKMGGTTVPFLDVQGTYKYKERPFDPNAKEELRPDYRMLGVAFDGPKNPYHIRVVGPAKTVEHYKPAFEEWLASFK
jgi:hypothetical protein